jgi:hypothetical protein
VTNCKTATADLIDTSQAQSGSISTMRRSIRKAVLRYLTWRAATQLRQLDPRTLKEFGVSSETILSIIHQIEIGDTP